MTKITLPYPPSSNRYWAVWRNRAVLTEEARAYKRDARLTAQAAGLFCLPPGVRVGVRLLVYRPQRSGDLDNRIKVALDALNGVTWTDDGQVVELHAYRYEDASNPRVEVMVWIVGEAHVQGRMM